MDPFPNHIVPNHPVCKNKLIYGLGVHHINKPEITYQGNDLSQLNFKLTNCLSFSMPLSIKTDLIAEALITVQGNNYELVPHASIIVPVEDVLFVATV